MTLTESIRDHMLAYLAGDSTLSEFEDWLVENTWDAHLSDPPAADLAYTIKRLVAEYTSEHRSEVDLKLALVPIVQQWPWGTVETIAAAVTVAQPREYVLELVA